MEHPAQGSATDIGDIEDCQAAGFPTKEKGSENILRRSRRSRLFWRSSNENLSCGLPCQRSELTIHGKSLLKALFPADHHHLEIVKAGDRIAHNNDEIDLGDCSGHCIHDSTLDLRTKKIKTCIASKTSDITLYNRRSRQYFLLEDAITISCKCLSSHYCPP
ncbi:Oidioi.mRNA.OKI2018_I69.PAR.g9422.t1.cds [Oikopleura dioica]|uniref:Oidioi.mRNA.OKI2018_I69.PAR.g9422.t1.cds n=1 Tax=Oikopleura dioica TaxID=34765 RepID=A0ABN7RKG2_OIKDI|nr:Oidioi.mRNA.OKI2018_I69.PAR.g9422.t1.cds [Oikopleura dioica]